MKYRTTEILQKIICTVLLIVSITFFMFSTINYNRISEKIINFKHQNTDNLYLRVSDVYGMDNQESLSEFFSEKDSLNRMYRFNEIVHKKFSFLEFDTQSLLMKDNFPYREEFREDYGSSYYGLNDDVGIEYNSVQVDYSTYDFFNLEDKIIIGSGFSKQSFCYDEDKTIDAVLGYEYTDLVQIGDILKADYLSKEINIKIIGFFEKDTFISVNNKIIFLDRYITIPFFNIDEHHLSDSKSSDEERFQKILYSLKNWGYIKVNSGDNYYDYRDKIDEISKLCNLKYILNEGYADSYITNISNTISSAKGMFLIFSVIIYLLTAFVILYIYIWRYKINIYDYSIQLISGCSLRRLKLKLFSIIFIQFIIAIISACIINKAVLGSESLYKCTVYLFDKALVVIICTSLVTMTIITLIINTYINHSNIYSSIRKKF